MNYGVDCASPVNVQIVQTLREQGYSFIGRYLVPTNAGYYKALAAAEAHVISGGGLGLLTVWETTADRVKGGGLAGSYDGRAARACAEAIGMPKHGVIYFAVDYEPGRDEYRTIAEYFREAAKYAAPYTIGIYGCFGIVEYIGKLDICRSVWQCCAWSYGQISRFTDCYQALWSGHPKCQALSKRIGIAVDINEAEDLDNAGIWQYEEDEIVEIDRLIETMTDEQAYRLLEKAQRHAEGLPLPDGWNAKDQLQKAVADRITDGESPMRMVTRLEAALMADRAKGG